MAEVVEQLPSKCEPQVQTPVPPKKKKKKEKATKKKNKRTNF
jgi:hypothetical protein